MPSLSAHMNKGHIIYSDMLKSGYKIRRQIHDCGQINLQLKYRYGKFVNPNTNKQWLGQLLDNLSFIQLKLLHHQN